MTARRKVWPEPKDNYISGKIKLDFYGWKKRPCEQVEPVLKAYFFIPELCAHYASQTSHPSEEPFIMSV